MLQEVKDLQQRAVKELFDKTIKANEKKEITFRAPTGSGKTHMMADYMNRVLKERNDVVFLVSTLSKGELAKQNYNVFKRLKDNGTFTEINPFLISSLVSTEENLYIPTSYNVYVLPRDLYKKGGRLMQGAMAGWLQTMTQNLFGTGLNKQIYVIKDECHQATNNLDNLSEDYFSRTINFSATPKLKRGQIPDVEITDEQAVQAKLIKHIDFGNSEQLLQENGKTDAINQQSVLCAIEKFKEIKPQYVEKLKVNPCLIIQISNKDKADSEWKNLIKPVLDNNPTLKWMLIVDSDKNCDTNDVVKKNLPVKKWKDYAKDKSSNIDVIIFKMVISEGWDIPRACMLCQVRKTISDQLDEQVIGRVRRNPRLLDFETLTPQAQSLAMTAWVWGNEPKEKKKSFNVRLLQNLDTNIRQDFIVRTTKLADLTEKKDFNIEEFFENKKDKLVPTDIFSLYDKLQKQENEIQSLCWDYTKGDISRYWRFCENIDGVKKEYHNYKCDYEQSMKEDKPTSFPISSIYWDNGNVLNIENWIWLQKTEDENIFSFDSEAEKKWAKVLRDICEKSVRKVSSNKDEKRFLWGKNFPFNSDIKYEYYNNGVHASYPDFILKDKQDRIHIFEVKSVNNSNNQNINREEYEEKVRILGECYLYVSKILENHIFYLPILQNEDWQITKYENGRKSLLSEQQFKENF